MSSIAVTQNYLVDSSLIKFLIKNTNITSEDVVIDIGAGKGIITQELASVANKVLAVERDGNLLLELNQKFSSVPNVQIINSDILEWGLPNTPIKVFSNIPFNITSKIVNKLIFNQNPVLSAYLVMQREAARRFMGEEEGFLISALIKPFYNINIIYEFSPKDFNPVPSVHTVLIAFEKRYEPLVKSNERMSYYDFVSYVSLQQKISVKYRTNKLFTFEQFKRLCKDTGISADTTIKQLSINQWVGLFNAYSSFVPSDKKTIVHGSFNNYRKTLDKAPIGSRTKIRL